MKARIFLLILAVVFGLNGSSCSTGRPNENAEVAMPQDSSSLVEPVIQDRYTGTPCDRLNELTNIPYSYGESSDDPIYNALIAMGPRSVPCLVEKITDTTKMKDPRTAPHVEDFRVGDAAFFMLLYVTRIDWQPKTMFPPKYAALWKTEGVYAYFAYVEDPQNRKKFQNWWKHRMNVHSRNA